MNAPISTRTGDDLVSNVVTDLLESIRVACVSYAPSVRTGNWSSPVERGSRTAFYVVRSGGALLEIGAEKYALSSGDVCLLPHGHAHTLSSAGVERTDLLAGSIELEDRSNHPLLDVLPHAVVIAGRDGRAAEWLEPTLEFMRWEADSGRMGADAVVSRLATILVIQIVRSYLASSPATEPSWRRALDDPRIGIALSSIHRDPNHAWTVESLAGRAGMSRSTFAGRFAELVGEPPLHYITRLRMQKARALLRDGKATLAAVAENSGYESEAAFSKAFKRWVGVAPGTYRRQNRPSSVTPRGPTPTRGALDVELAEAPLDESAKYNVTPPETIAAPPSTSVSNAS
jgi:AraC-like DNA-binding protein